MLNQGVGSWLQRRVQKSGTEPAVIFHDEVTTYAQLAERSTRLSNVLHEWGVTKGSRVAYLGENHPSFLECFFAATQLGAIMVPLNTRLAPAELGYLLQDSGAKVLLVSAALHETALSACEHTAVEHVVRVGAELDALIAEGDPTYIDHDVQYRDPAVIMYTSGTTGHPKGAVLTHQNYIWNSYNVLVDYDLVSTDISLMISPLFHAAALGMGALPALLKGATIVLESGFEPGNVLELIEKHRATTISGVPTTYQMLCEHPNWATADISSLRMLTCGGSPVPMRVLEAYESRGLAFTGGYGMTETSPGATSLQPSQSRPKQGSAGLPHFFTDVRIADVQGNRLPVGEVGEIQISGPNVIAEYWNLPEATSDAFAEGVWFKSGDMGYLDADGFLFVTDRLKDMIISGGENIYPAEIEQHIMELDEVSAAAVIGIPDEKWGERPLALITLRAGATVQPEDVREHLLTKLARYKVPKNYLIIEEMPRTASGKIRKTDLRQRYGEPAQHTEN